jgi:hypothetical protein
MRIPRQPQAAVDNHPARRGRLHQPGGEAWIVRYHGADAYKDSIVAASKLMGQAQRLLTADPLRVAAACR